MQDELELRMDRRQKDSTADRLQPFVLNALRDVTGLAQTLTIKSSLEDLGLDSLAVMNFNARIASVFPDAAKTFLYDCRFIDDICGYLQRCHPEAVARLQAAPEAATAVGSEAAAGDSSFPAWEAISPLGPHALPDDGDTARAVAIIGMNGRFPGADTLEAFWSNILGGVDSVGEIPNERWPLDGFFEAANKQRSPSSSYSKWGGFISGADRFDAQFFGVSSREAALMDPQSRLFLECAWHALEDGGLVGERAEALRQNGSFDIGVFVGQTTNTYSLLGPDRWRSGLAEIPTTMPWSTANRVSYALNFCGPSLAIDTACSSSLVAIHLACESLLRGECRAAVAGGVNLYLHPSKYVQLSQQQMLSPTGRCRAFGLEADGFVPGEGVGAIILKPLAAAERDGDRILAVIRGSAVRHGGRSNGYTVPSPAAQARVISEALSVAGLNGTELSYIEAHGTGTKLGDPIEIDGLKQALGTTAQCVVGSVKSNIGHLEGAAGIASIIKTVLQIRARTIAPTLHADTLNPALPLAGTAFSIPRTAARWRATPEYGLLCAGVSSFGAGGANAHVIIEESLEAEPDSVQSTGPMAFVVSARTQAQLLDAVVAIRKIIANTAFDAEKELARLAYTLQCGRHHFDFRFATIAARRSELAAKLDAFIARPSTAESDLIYSGRTTTAEDRFESVPPASLSERAKAWSLGVPIAWSSHWNSRLTPIDAPLYPFASDRHWVSPLPEVRPQDTLEKDPLEKVSFAFAGEDLILRQHRIKGRPVLPAAAYLDFCVGLATKGRATGAVELRNLTWATPFTPAEDNDGKIDCSIQRQPSANSFEFTSTTGGTNVKHFGCRGIESGNDTMAAPSQLAISRARCIHNEPVEPCYATFAAQGIDYGASFRCLSSARLGLDEAVVELCQQNNLAANPTSVFDIGLLDGVLQSAFLALPASRRLDGIAYVPFSARSIRVFSAPHKMATVHVRRRPADHVAEMEVSGMEVMDFTVYDPDGVVQMEIEEFAFRRFTPERIVPRAFRHDVHILESVWIDEPATGAIVPRSVLVFDKTSQMSNRLRASLSPDQQGCAIWLAQESDRFEFRTDRVIEWSPRASKHMDLVWRTLAAQGGVPTSIIFNLTQKSPASGTWQARLGLTGIVEVADILRSLCRREASARIHVQFVLAADEAGAAALCGLMRSLHLELPTLTATVMMAGENTSPERVASSILGEAMQVSATGVTLVRLAGSKRQVHRLRFASEAGSLANSSGFTPVGGDETYVITGGMGSLGQLFASSLAGVAGMKLALLGRSPASEQTARALAELEEAGARSAYWQVDCVDRDALADCLAQVRRRFGPVTGVVHCAGVLRDAFFVRQSTEDFDTVVRTKALSISHLDELTRNDPIKRFVLCSSLAGVYGNAGQSAYGLANAWLDAFAVGAPALGDQGRPAGESVSIAWPLWATSDGMQAPAPIKDWLARNGLALLPADEGVRIFEHALANPRQVIIPVKGDREAVGRLFGVAADTEADALTRPARMEAPSTSGAAPGAEPAVLAFLVRTLSKSRQRNWIASTWTPRWRCLAWTRSSLLR